ncbi:sulfite exporter TauE/SafE family protein [Rossellomorea vietnamensis]|uniref:sulfite exporter TauE/SafE family protein n=1 Tax=Rossellomorea vietnamensis TaxID=218284 RepID=UPI001E504A79|nr:sulfite exporter TauE/SafE family protein [Rossellomorea vietnamensis]MCC5800999.1 sulfite exporter TauE/SafE family protein [Rossellomorea vietnamensis]
MAIILCASILQTSTGFGFSIMATPFLLLLYPPKEAIQINLILSLVISLALVVKIRRDIDFTLVKRFVIGSVPGLFLGIVVFTLIDMSLLKVVISLVIILLTILLILKFRIRQSTPRDFLAGGLSGVLTTSIGMPGPPLLLYFSGTGTKKEKLRGTTLAFYLFIYLVSLGIQVNVAGTTLTVWKSSLQALPVVAVGLLSGQALFSKINQKLFQIVTYVLLLFSGIYLLIESIF